MHFLGRNLYKETTQFHHYFRVSSQTYLPSEFPSIIKRGHFELSVPNSSKEHQGARNNTKIDKASINNHKHSKASSPKDPYH
jgi:hypothetical protein